MGVTTLTMDYEALVPSTANIDDNVRQLHWRMLLAAVEETGMDKCRLVDPFATRRDLESTPSNEEVPYFPTLYAIENDFEDSSLMQLCKYLQTIFRTFFGRSMQGLIHPIFFAFQHALPYSRKLPCIVFPYEQCFD